MTDTTDGVTPGGNSEGNVVRPAFGKAAHAPQEEKECTCRMIFTCMHCSCRSYNLFSDGTIACSYCEEVVPRSEVGSEYGVWFKHTEGAGVTSDMTPVPFDKHDFDGGEFARRVVLKRVDEWARAEELQCITAFHTDGDTTSWFNIDTEKKRQWILDRMREDMAYVEGLEIPPDGDQLDLDLSEGKP